MNRKGFRGKLKLLNLQCSDLGKRACDIEPWWNAELHVFREGAHRLGTSHAFGNRFAPTKLSGVFAHSTPLLAVQRCSW